MDYTPHSLDDDRTRGGFARLATAIAARKQLRESKGPVLILDGGDFSMGTAFGAAIRDRRRASTSGPHGLDATTFGNHEFDLGPDGLGQAIRAAARAGRIPAIVPSNTRYDKDDPTLADLQRLGRDGVLRRHVVIERGGMRFGIFGLLGKETQFYTTGGAAEFADATETARTIVTELRDVEQVDVVIALSTAAW